MKSRFRTCITLAATLVLGLLFSSFQTAGAQTPPPNVGDVLISEFRTRGPNGPNDEFIEIYNNTDSNIVVGDSHPTCASRISLTPPIIKCGWAIVDPTGAISGIPRAIIPFGETIPARGHYLLASSGDASNPGYNPATYGGTIADTTYDPPAYGDTDYLGLVLYATADSTQFATDTPLDAVGFDAIGTPYREGTGLQPPSGVSGNIEHSFVRKVSVTTIKPIDTNNNINDFVFVATTAGAAGSAATAVLGAPGPESTTSPVESTNKFTVVLYDTSRTQSQAPNRCYDATDTAPGAGTKGSLFVRRNITNNTAPVTQLRFRVIDITTVGSPGSTNPSQAIIKSVSSFGGTTPCPNTLFNGTPATAQDTTLDAPSPASGGGLNSSLSTTPIPAGQSRNVLFRLAAERTGTFRFFFMIESN